MALTVMEVLNQTARKFPTKPAIRFKDKSKKGSHYTSNTEWTELTWLDYQQTVWRLARGLGAMGIKPADKIIILGHNCQEWVLADVGSICIGAVPAGVYPTSSAEQCAYILQHSKASCVFVENDKQLEKVYALRERLPNLKFFVLMKGSSHIKDVLSWDELLLKSNEFSEEELIRRIKQQKPNDLATLVYTSGTTSHPKAVMLSHDNLTWMSQMCVQFDMKLCDSDELISYLPLSHIAEQMTTIHGPMFVGATVSFAESMDKLPENLREVKPTLLLGVPRVWEKIQAKMEEKASQASFLKRKLLAWASNIGRTLGHDADKNSYLSYKLADKLVYSKVRKALGLDRCRFQVTAAAPISKDTLDFFMGFGIPLYELYGMSECTGPATISTITNLKLGSVGTCIKGGEVKIAEDGEILIKGRHVFLGYLDDPEATKEALDEQGYLHSGDIGMIDDEGFLFITGRKKNLIITAGGENIAPEMIENKLKSIPEIEQAVVIGDKRKYLTALLTLNPEALSVFQSKGMTTRAKTSSELCQCPNFKSYIQSRIEDVNAGIARVQTIKNFRLLPNSFSEESGEMTPTMKVKRAFVLKKYSSEIDLMYA